MRNPAPQTCLRMPRCRGIEIEECSVSQLQEYLSTGVFTSRELAQCYLRRIELVNPRVKAVIETNPDALDIADKLDEERRYGHVRARFHGIPFIVKDNIATKGKMQTTAGCAALIGTVLLRDARVVGLLLGAVAVLLGKANLSEFASMRASYYAEGYSSRGGQNRNPYNLAHNPGGSSSGSASSLASNMCAFSIGTEAGGSIMFPADRNSVVDIKPTVGLTSTLGVIPESPRMDWAILAAFLAVATYAAANQAAGHKPCPANRRAARAISNPHQVPTATNPPMRFFSRERHVDSSVNIVEVGQR